MPFYFFIMRLFTGFSFFNDPLIFSHQEKLMKLLSFESIRWTPPNSFHLTLCFIGETPEQKLPAIKQTLSNVKSQVPLTLTFENTGIFGSKYQPRIIFIKINPSESISIFQSNMSNLLISSGIKLKQEPFRPHLTIGRIKNINDKNRFWKVIEENNNPVKHSVLLDNFCLFSSEFTSKIVNYNILEIFKLDNNDTR